MPLPHGEVTDLSISPQTQHICRRTRCRSRLSVAQRSVSSAGMFLIALIFVSIDLDQIRHPFCFLFDRISGQCGSQQPGWPHAQRLVVIHEDDSRVLGVFLHDAGSFTAIQMPRCNKARQISVGRLCLGARSAAEGVPRSRRQGVDLRDLGQEHLHARAGRN